MTHTFWFKDVRVVDVALGKISAPQCVAIEDKTIAALASCPPSDGPVIDACGLFLAPGLIDSHVHLFLAGDGSPLQTFLTSSDEQKLATAEANARIALQSGITTVRDCGAPRALMTELRNRVARNKVPGPHLVTCGAPITRRRGHLYFFGEEVSNSAEVRAAVLRQLRDGHNFIKLIASGGGLTPDTNPAVADFPELLMHETVSVAHSNGAQVAAHCHATESIVRALHCGVDVIEHASFVTSEGYRYDADIACQLRDAGTVVDPTVMGALRSAEQFRRLGHNQNRADRKAIERLEGRLKNSALFREMGLKIVAGTDAGVTNTGFNTLVEELLAYRSVGFSSAEALRSATCDAALHLRLGNRGQVLAGWQADLVLLEHNPFNNLETLGKPKLVMKSGRVFHSRLVAVPAGAAH